MLKKIFLGAFAGILILSAGGALYLYLAVNADIDEKFAGTCEAVPLAGSGEDIQVDRDSGYAYLSMLDRLGVAQGLEIDPGMVMRIDLNDPGRPVVPALLDGPELHPHGLSLYRGNDGKLQLFVINHPKDRANGSEALERYTETSDGLFAHAETYASPLITRANDMVAVGPRQFYVAQDVDRQSGDTVTDLVYFNGSDYAVIANDIQSGGGINVSADGSTLYISETGGKRIRVAERNPNGTLVNERFIQLDTSPDNIDVAADGSLWVGGHSNVIALAMHFIAGSNAPSQILRIDAQSEPAQIEEIYLNAGDEISAGSGGATFGDTLLIGSITARKVLACTMDDTDDA
ncbi:MAG: hypothetical protein HKN56_04850 [Gammaproteobacteria bacterium]|nr:hypothetical protein [Gammaproteobacteria bacterium]